MIYWVWLIACNKGSSDTAATEQSIHANITLLSINNRPQVEIPIYADETIHRTEEDGSAKIELDPNQPFAIVAEENDSLTHRYLGVATNRNFALNALFIDRGSWNSILGSLQLTDEVGTGHIWIAVTNSNFLPIEGAQVLLISGTSDEPFTLLQTNVPWFGDTLGAGDRGWIFYPNVTPDDVILSVTTPTEQPCGAFVGGVPNNQFEIAVYADTASIFWFICQ